MTQCVPKKGDLMVSLIIPVYNSEQQLPSCIDSALAQTYQDLEILLINDGSTDRSLEICQQYAARDSRIRIVSQPNGGVSIARNRGIAEARGEYIQFMDSDDHIDPGMVATMVSYMERYDVDLVFCGIEERSESGVRVLAPEYTGKIRMEQLRELCPNLFHNSGLNSPVNKLYRRRKILNSFPADLSLGEDLLFNLNYLRNISTIYMTQECLYVYETHEGSLNFRYRENSIEIAERLYEASMSFIDEYQLGAKPEQDAASMFMLLMCYGLADLYTRSGKSDKEKKRCVIGWMKNANVRRALKTAKMEKVKYRIALFLFRYRLSGLFHLMMRIKG